ncbi:MAG: heme-binding domain-containing protein [Gemmatimonadetes bacterium]|nr:heme-binding domain-containing protein [Gemmatimonadota bacterium]
MKKILIGLVVLFAGIQFVPVERTNPPVTQAIDAPPAVQAILDRSCADCHSNQTRWPWYSRVAPASWLVAKDVREGREKLNFSEFGDYPERRQRHKVSEVLEEVEHGEMPLKPYLLIHRDAKVSEPEIETLRAWVAVAGEAPRGEEEGESHES